MGWTNSHLHHFIKNGVFYSKRMEDDDFWDDGRNVDYEGMNIRVSNLLKREKEKIQYEYDFGDGWLHDIILEKILPVDNKVKYPICVGGKMNCPPEDCGGVWSYANMLTILKQPDHESHEEYVERIGDDFDPEYFDMNELLRRKGYGCFEL